MCASGERPREYTSHALTSHGPPRSLFIRYTTNIWPTDYIPKVFPEGGGNSSTNLMVDGTPVILELLDYAPREELYAREDLRPLIYQTTDVHMLCFSLVREDSLKVVEERWAPRVRQHSFAPIVLVGTKLDLRSDQTTLRQLGQHETGRLAPVSCERGAESARRIGAVAYRECSAQTGEGVKDVFETAVRAALQHKKADQKPAHVMPRKRCVIM